LEDRPVPCPYESGRKEQASYSGVNFYPKKRVGKKSKLRKTRLFASGAQK